MTILGIPSVDNADDDCDAIDVYVARKCTCTQAYDTHMRRSSNWSIKKLDDR